VGVRIYEGPIHYEIPDAWSSCQRAKSIRENEQHTAIHRIHCRTENKQRPQLLALMNSPQTQTHIEQNSPSVLPAIYQMREYILGIFITSHALQRTPDPWQTGEEAEETGVVGVTSGGVVPAVRVEAEEEFYVAHGVGLTAEHVSEEEVTEFDGVEAGEEEAPLESVSILYVWIR